jgi:hypothetical protein
VKSLSYHEALQGQARRCRAAMEKCHGWLVIFTWSPVIVVAMARPPARGSGLAAQAQVMPDGLDKRGVLVRWQDRHVRDRCAGLRLPAEAGIRAADVAKQARKG